MPIATKPKSVTIDAQNFFWGLSINPSLDEAGNLRLSGAITLHRAQKHDDGTYTRDPSADGVKSIAFGDLVPYLNEHHPELLPQVMEAWGQLDAVVDALNAKLQLV